ncbi:MAG: ATP-binding protein [Myxococcales bacterium]
MSDEVSDGGGQGDQTLSLLMHLSHEIRTPLNSMLALSQLLRDGLAGKLNSEQQRYVEVIERNGQNLIRLVSDILDLSRMEGGHVDVDVRLVDLEEQMRAAATALAPLAEAKGIELKVDVGESLPGVWCDPDRVRQVLTNLIGNAVKFTNRGCVTLTAEVRDGSVAVHVSDTGIGIPEEARSRVFEEFFQVGQLRAGVDVSGGVGPVEGGRYRRGRADGAGLGLAIASRLARMMGGELSVESAVGVGSRFTFAVPLAERTLQEAEEEGSDVASGSQDNGQRAEDVGRTVHRFQDEPHGTNTAGR